MKTATPRLSTLVLAAVLATALSGISFAGDMTVDNLTVMTNAVVYGKMGIGTNPPISRLDVNGDVMVRSNLTVSGTAVITNLVVLGTQTNKGMVTFERQIDTNKCVFYDPSGWGNFFVYSGNWYSYTYLRFADSAGLGPIVPSDSYHLWTMNPSYNWIKRISVTPSGVGVNSATVTTGYDFDLNGSAMVRTNLAVSGSARFNGGITYIPQMGDISMGSFTNAP